MNSNLFLNLTFASWINTLVNIVIFLYDDKKEKNTYLFIIKTFLYLMFVIISFYQRI